MTRPVDSSTRENVIVSLTGGRAALVVPRAADPDEERYPGLQQEAAVGDLIYTDEKDMPSLEQLLRENRVAYAVLEHESHHVSYLRVLAGGAVGVGTTVAGFFLLLQAIAPSVISANPYTALTLTLGGIVLVATLLVALYGPSDDLER
jgi:hypothetical protein